MGYYNDDVAGLFTGKRNTDNVAGTSTGKRRGTGNNNNVAGAFDDDFKVPVKAYIKSEDFCRAVRQCLINDLVAAAEDDNDNDDRKKHRRKRR